MTATVSNNIVIDSPDKAIIDYAESLSINNPEYDKKQRLGIWMGNTPKKIKLYSTKNGKLVLPYGCITDLTKMGVKIIPIFAEKHTVNYNCNIPLYDYQKEAVEVMTAKKFGILQSPAGSGKTQMGLAIICKLGLKALWITHTIDLLNQSYDRASRYISKSILGKITGGKINIGSGITFATVQTLEKMDLQDIKNEFDVIVVDECHRVAGSPTSATMFYKVLNNLSARYKFGISATVHRSDGLIECCYALLGKINYIVPTEAVQDKTVPARVVRIDTNIHDTAEYTDDMGGKHYLYEEYINPDGTINFTKLVSFLASDICRNKLIAQTIVKNKGYSSLILSDRLEQLQKIISYLPDELKSDCAFINGKMTSKKDKVLREQLIDDMREQKKKYLFASYNLAKEGLDVPILSRLYLATPHKDYAVIVQSVGRIQRKADKPEAIVYDFVDDTPYCLNAFTSRKRIYKKCNCYV